jgi:hypothetical protein
VDNINVISVTVSPRKNAAAVSYQNGEVRLYMFPCLEYVNTPYILLGGIATQAMQLAFSSDGRYLVMLDSYTRAVLQVALRGHMAEAGVVPRSITDGARVVGAGIKKGLLAAGGGKGAAGADDGGAAVVPEAAGAGAVVQSTDDAAAPA